MSKKSNDFLKFLNQVKGDNSIDFIDPGRPHYFFGFLDKLKKSPNADSGLDKDIMQAIDCIKRIEISEIERIYNFRKRFDKPIIDLKAKQRIINPNIKVYKKEPLQILNRILGKMKIRISLSFFDRRSKEFLHSNTKSSKNKKLKKRFEKLLARKSLSFKLISAPLLDDLVIPCNCLGSNLSSMIFNYLVDLSNGEPGRPRKCLFCKKWFLAYKSNHLCCTKKCNDGFYAKTPKGRSRISEASRRYRSNHSKKMKK